MSLMHNILESYAAAQIPKHLRAPVTTDEFMRLLQTKVDLLAALTKIKTHSRDAAIRQIAANAIAKAES